LFLLKLISKKLSRKEGKVNTMQHGQGEKHRHMGKNIDTGGNIDTEGKNIFPQYTACKSRTINCMAKEGKN
jgi:hypothetical protein